ncbi:MAG TPA: HNH endonuclease signature motif containing protein [Gemmatimonadaceae bacterium]
MLTTSNSFLSQSSHDSPYRDAPAPSSASNSKPTAASRSSSDRSARQAPATHRPPQARASHTHHASHDGGANAPARAKTGRRRRRGGSPNSRIELTSHPTSRNAYIETRAWLLAQHGPVCAYCGVKFTASVMTLDHVAPRRGQTAYDRRDNLVLACPGCNMIKRDQAPLAFLLGSRIRAVNLVRYGSHLSPMLVDLARSLVPAGADAASPAADASAIDWASLIDLDGESPYRN